MGDVILGGIAVTMLACGALLLAAVVDYFGRILHAVRRIAAAIEHRNRIETERNENSGEEADSPSKGSTHGEA